MVRHFFTRQFVSFVLVGGISAFLHWLARIALSYWVSFPVAVFLAYGVGMAVAFTLNALYVFPDATGSRATQGRNFVLTNLGFLPVVWGVALLAEWVFGHWLPQRIAEAAAHGVAVVTPMFATFLIYKFFAFKDVGNGRR